MKQGLDKTRRRRKKISTGSKNVRARQDKRAYEKRYFSPEFKER